MESLSIEDSTFQLPSDFFLPRHQFESSLKAIVASAVIIGISHLVILYILTSRNKTKSKSNQRSSDQVFKASYQIAHLLVNLYFGIYAFYICFIKQHSDDVFYGNVFDKNTYRHIFGYEQYCLFGAVQVGYNLWSLPVGLLFAKEPPPMIAHHISVIIICSLTATSHFGYRLHAPFLLGMFEISSVPLSVSNFIKDHDDHLKKSTFLQELNVQMKTTFAILFLGIRIIIGTPHVYHTIRGAYISMTIEGCGMNIVLRGWMFMVLVGQVVLFLLQLYWAKLIVKGLIKIFSKKGPEKKA
jgi:hypothetical protein